MNFESIGSGFDPLSAFSDSTAEALDKALGIQKFDGEYEVVFKVRPLGFTIWKDTRGNNAEVIRIDSEVAKELGVTIGSRLLKINGTAVEYVPHEQILDIIKKGSFPMTVSFRAYPDRQKYLIEKLKKQELAKQKKAARIAAEEAAKAKEGEAAEAEKEATVSKLQDYYGTGKEESGQASAPAEEKAEKGPSTEDADAQSPKSEEEEDEFAGFGADEAAQADDDDGLDLDAELAKLAGTGSAPRPEKMRTKATDNSRDYDGLSTVLSIGEKNNVKIDDLDKDLLQGLEDLDAGLEDIGSSLTEAAPAAANPNLGDLDLDLDMDNLLSGDTKKADQVVTGDMDDMLAYINSNS